MINMRNLFILFCAFYAAIPAFAAISVTPTLVEINAVNSKRNFATASFDVSGGKNETIRFKVYPEYFEISSEGTMNVIDKKDAPDSLVSKARFVPNEFTLTGGKSQKVRLTVADINTLKDGESRMVLFLEDVKAKELILPNNYKNVTTKLIVKTRVGVPVYVDKGHVIKTGNIDTLDVHRKDKDLVYKMKITSSGNSKIRCAGKVQLTKGKELIEEYPLKNAVVGGKNFLNIEDKIPLEKISENGNYTLRVLVHYQDEKGRNKVILKEAMFTVDNISKPNI